MPMTLYCPYKLGYILVGGITVNNIPMKSDLQDKVLKQCERQMKKYELGRLDETIAPKGDGIIFN